MDMESADKNKKGTSIPPRLTIRTRRQVAAEKRKAEEELMRVEEEKRSRSLFAPRVDGSIGPGPGGILIGQEDPVEVKVEVKLENPEGEEGQMGCDGGFEGFDQIGKVEDNVVIVKYEEMIDDSEGASVGEHLVEECVSLDEEEGIAEDEVWEIAEENITVVKVLPYILPLLKQRDVFRCRLVNKLWRRMVDDFLEDCLVPQHYDDQAFLQKVKSSPSKLCPIPKFRIVKSAYKFKSEESLQKFNELMAPHVDLQQNPFVGGATIALKNFFSASCRLSRATEQFLDNFGVHIRRLIIHQGGLDVDFEIVGFVDCVKKCLHYVPNLEKLKINGSRVTRFERITSTTPDFRLELYRNELFDRMPKLDKLDTLEFQSLHLLVHDTTNGRYDPFPYSPYLEEIFGDLMIKPYYQTQMKNLSLDWPNNKLKFKMSNVKELSLANLQCKFSELKIQAPVEKLTLSTYDGDIFWKEGRIDLKGIFQKFPHLRYLRVGNMDTITCLKELNLPENNVHTLEILCIGIHEVIPEEIMNGFAKLRYLILHTRNYKPGHCFDHILGQQYEFENGKVEVAHLICGRTSYDSNLWTSLPQLEILTLQFKSYCRKRYNCTSLSECGCRFVAIGRLEDCPFKNIVETREGYLKYQERVSLLAMQCFTEELQPVNDLKTLNENKEKEDVEKKRNLKKLLPEKHVTTEPQVLSLVLPFLDPKDILKCRQVSKQWRRMVDDFIKKFVVPEHYDDKAYLKKMERSPKQVCPLPKFRNVECAYRFRGERELEHFNERMAAHVDLELSPFVGDAAVTFDSLRVKSPAPRLGPALKKFLEEFGMYIRNLVIKQTERKAYSSKSASGLDVVRFVEFLELCLHFVPNLERLKLVGYCPIEENQSELDKSQWDVHKNEFLSRVPKLNELTSLEFEFCSTIIGHSSFPMVVMIKPFYQTQLKNLQLVGTPTENINFKMCNLKELTLKISANEPMNILEGNWIEAPVEKLNLIICKLGDNFNSRIREIFNILQIFPLVRYLKIEDQHFQIFYSTISSVSSYIHTLELTKFDYYNDCISDAFLRGFPNLRFLIIRGTNFYGRNVLDQVMQNGQTVPEDETGELKISNLFYGGTTYDTNIWELLSTLEVFTFQFRNHAHLSYGRLPPREYLFHHFQGWCNCENVKETKDQCPFKNILETRQGYLMYHERLSRLMKQI